VASSATCVYTPAGADNAAKTAVCVAITNTAGAKCQVKSDFTACEARVCAGKTDATS
jgi:hypothetical protein